MNLAIQVHSVPACHCPAALATGPSCIHVVYANPVVVPVNGCACDLVELLQLLAADLAYLSIGHLDLAVVA